MITTLWLVICVVILVYSIRRLKPKKYGKVGILVVACMVFLLGSKVIDLNTLSKETSEKLSQVAEICGDTYIRTEGKDIYVKVKGNWLNLKNINIIGDVLTDSITIEYEGNTIYLGESGVVNTVRALESVGLIESK